MMFRPIRDNIVVRPDPALTITASGLHIPQAAQRPSKRGTIEAIGPDCELPVQTSDTVIFQAGAGQYITYNDETFVILRPVHILALIEQ